MKIYEVLKGLELPVAYGLFREKVEPPFIVYMGEGQNQFKADDKRYHHYNTYRVEYYFKYKDESMEEDIEAAFDSAKYPFEKSEDIYLDEEDVFVIYYYIN